jgi:cyanuric acid amidohydrolase
MTVEVVAYETAHPGDVRDLARHLERFDPARIRRLALLVKTEGNSDINDYTREYAMQSASLAIESRGGHPLLERSTFLFSTGCEGAMTPFGILFADFDEQGAKPARARALAIGCARSRSLEAEEIGTPLHADLTADTVKRAMDDAGVGPADVGLVIVKTPVMSFLPSKSTRRISSGYSKAVGALGAGVALGEVERRRIVQEAFDQDHTLHAKRAMVFSGAERDCVEILLLANRAGASGTLGVHTGYLRDVLDAKGLRDMYAAAGCALVEGAVADPSSVVATLIKAGVAPDGRVRGRRTTIKSSHIDMDKHVRAAMSGIVGSILGDTRVFISANTVHQAPAGGGLCACIVRGA